ncbi:FAD-dependent 5-carboxymethylaminomethyl-2-thiouridine(34) oxidoreductase MnmC [Uruburuella testudinis]|uniref:FAD-dependent 5-carboxymethylaminomethyl-2-thiouridine(34) oxidoreductase MnmC n=1 Tax=Uruburuella testudinis TaxID=1282863 RepID=A0ABY4DWB3_9NEIS|nr:FAD-dependent 5-carboxymethylaminomethyl-2-thiouridine(34) oxidoreductase MnmC [Uruburuella testudinis]UOO82927.1 FAD-dependent 5-carboxymethylaminomethyl-2-thiouridine(34) oxidoreductase MnmC [Uruburuella testudinis]
MNFLAWNAPPPLAAIAQAVQSHAAPLYLIVCLHDTDMPAFRPSENPSALETQLQHRLNTQIGCLQFNGPNALNDILPGVHLWLLPPRHAARLGDYFNAPIQWQTPALPQEPQEQAKPWLQAPRQSAAPTRAIVIGAGIAGAATARALAERGLPVTVLEAGEPAQAASGNRQGLLYAKISAHNTEQTELLLCGYGHSRRLLQKLLPDSNTWGGNGILHLNHSAAETKRNHALGQQRHHAHLYRSVNAAEASKIAGLPIASDGLYWPQGVWLNPPALVQALLDHPLITLHSHTPLLHAVHNGREWQAATPAQTFCGSHIIYCLGAHSPDAADFNLAALPYQLIRGQTSLAAVTAQSARLRCALSGATYISPAWQGLHCYGATFLPHDADSRLRTSDEAANRAGLAALHPALAHNLLSDGPNRRQTNGQNTLGCPDNLFMRGFLFLKMQMPGKKRSKIGHLARLFNAADAFSGAKYTRKSNGQDTLGHAAVRCDSPDHLPMAGPLGDIRAIQSAYAKLALDKNYRLNTPCPYLPDAYINTAHGSRGLATAPICAESIAARILGLPDPLSPRLRNALHPNRSIIRAIVRHERLSERA